MKDQYLEELKQDLEDRRLTMQLIEDILPAIEKISHHQKITKKLVDAIEATGHRAWISDHKLFIVHKNKRTPFENIRFRSNYDRSFTPTDLIKYLKEDFHVKNLKTCEKQIAHYEKDREELIKLRDYVKNLNLVAYTTYGIINEIERLL